MEGELKLLGIEGCEPCEKVKEMLGDTMEFIDLSKPENAHYAESMESIKVPVAMDEKGNFCEIFFDEDSVIAQCGDEIIELYSKVKREE